MAWWARVSLRATLPPCATLFTVTRLPDTHPTPARRDQAAIVGPPYGPLSWRGDVPIINSCRGELEQKTENKTQKKEVTYKNQSSFTSRFPWQYFSDELGKM